MSRLVDARNIHKAFGTGDVLAGVDLQADAGEAVGIVGANGAGKTTLLEIAAGVLDADAGTVHLEGDELAQLKRREIARRVAVVPQYAPQVFDYSVLEFVLMGLHAQTSGFLPRADEIEAGRRALGDVELDEMADRPVSKLSGGEMQRALVARALVSPADLWLLDEPTASLDVRHRSTVLDRVRSHVDDGGGAVAILHDLELVHRYFDRVLALVDGTFRADGPPDEVLTPRLVSKMYGVQMHRGRVDGRVVWIVDD